MLTFPSSHLWMDAIVPNSIVKLAVGIAAATGNAGWQRQRSRQCRCAIVNTNQHNSEPLEDLAGRCLHLHSGNGLPMSEDAPAQLLP